MEEVDVDDIGKVINPAVNSVFNSMVYAATVGWVQRGALYHSRLPSGPSTASTPSTPWTLFHSSSIPTISSWFRCRQAYMHSALWGWPAALLGTWVRRCRFYGVYIALLYTLHELSEHSPIHPAGAVPAVPVHFSLERRFRWNFGLGWIQSRDWSGLIVIPPEK